MVNYTTLHYNTTFQPATTGTFFSSCVVFDDSRLSSASDQNQLTFLNTWLDAHIQDAQSVLHKPLFITEFGKSWKDPGFSTYQRDMLFNTVYSKIYESARHGGAAAGGLFWQVLAPGMDAFKDGYEIILDENSSTGNLIAQQAHKLYQIRKIFFRMRNLERWKRAHHHRLAGHRGKPNGN